MAQRDYGSRRFGSEEIPWDQILRVAPLVLGFLLVAYLAWHAFYTVDAHEQAVVMRFGKHYATMGPGLHLKIPLVDEAVPVSVRENSLRLPFSRETTTPRSGGSRRAESKPQADETPAEVTKTPPGKQSDAGPAEAPADERSAGKKADS